MHSMMGEDDVEYLELWDVASGAGTEWISHSWTEGLDDMCFHSEPITSLLT
jgi:hypothetical protein